MSLNWKEINLCLEELELSGSHIQKIKQPDFQSMLFDVYKPGKRLSLFISLTQGKTRIHSVGRKLASAEKLQRFAQFLRSRILGGKILRIYQVNNERIIKMEIVRTGEITVLWIRLWGGAANIIATEEDGSILDAFYRRPKRNEISSGFYNPEKNPPPAKADSREYVIRDLPGEGNFNSRIEDFYFSSEEASTLEILTRKSALLFNARISRMETTIHNVEKRIDSLKDFDQLKDFGDLILSNLYKIKRGDKWLSAENYCRNNENVEIELNPELTPEKNAEKFYKEFRKSKTEKLRLDEDLQNSQLALSLLINDRNELIGCKDINRLNSFICKNNKKRSVKSEKNTPGLKYQSGNYNILIGRTADENDSLLRKHVKGNDYWLHTRDYPGAYVFIKTVAGKSVPLNTLLDAGNLALFYSKGKSGGQGELYYTRVKYLRRTKGGKKGVVLPSNEKNLSIKLDKKRLLKMMNPEESVI